MLEWLAMGKYAIYVWPTYGIALLGLSAILGSALIAHARAEKSAKSSDGAGKQ
jgi:heme exporter protein CcmD